MKTLHRIALAAAFVLGSSSASAASVHVKFDNPIFSGLAAPSYDAVTITYPTLSGGASASASVAAGRFQGTASNLVGVDPAVFIDGVDDLFMYCYDLYETVHAGQEADFTVVFGGAAARTLEFLGAVNSVLSAGLDEVDPYAWLHPADGLMGAAIQLGIWESRYDSGWNIGSGAFRASGLEAQTVAYLDSFFAALPGAAPLDSRYVMTLEASGVQDMITGDPPAGVPEPGTLALAAAALAAALRRPRKA